MSTLRDKAEISLSRMLDPDRFGKERVVNQSLISCVLSPPMQSAEFDAGGVSQGFGKLACKTTDMDAPEIGQSINVDNVIYVVGNTTIYESFWVSEVFE